MKIKPYTPTPWLVDGNCIRGDKPAGGTLVCTFPYISRGYCEGNKEFVVRACNSHYALVAALESALERTSNIEWQAQYRHALNAANL